MTSEVASRGSWPGPRSRRTTPRRRRRWRPSAPWAPWLRSPSAARRRTISCCSWSRGRQGSFCWRTSRSSLRAGETWHWTPGSASSAAVEPAPLLVLVNLRRRGAAGGASARSCLTTGCIGSPWAVPSTGTCSLSHPALPALCVSPARAKTRCECRCSARTAGYQWRSLPRSHSRCARGARKISRWLTLGIGHGAKMWRTARSPWRRCSEPTSKIGPRRRQRITLRSSRRS
mmetsp:Transcript_177889/g.564475  ORF Transcript_177889/g.564475 Transcript_177889/m.564475 type:complete len:231 (+) Transcript_177889:195-887(+)